jgi:hypothetical protein
VVFVFFTLIPNKHWRYVLPLFPVLAISAVSFIFFFYEKAEGAWRGHMSISKKRAVKVAAGLFVLFLSVGGFFSAKDAYDWSAKYQFKLILREQQTTLAAASAKASQSCFFAHSTFSIKIWYGFICGLTAPEKILCISIQSRQLTRTRLTLTSPSLLAYANRTM